MEVGMRKSSSTPWIIAIWILIAPIVMLFSGCAVSVPPSPAPPLWIYKAQGSIQNTAWAPAFVVYDHNETYNRIGRPTVRIAADGEEKVYIDPENPAVYFMKRTFTTKKAAYTNLIYRIHFSEVPFSLIPFNLTAGKNVGLIVVITLDAGNHPVLVTTVHTCGCYLAIVPTSYLPKNDFPKDWHGKMIKVYGEHLPSLLEFKGIAAPRILVYLRPEVHRVMNLEVHSDKALLASPYRIIPMPIEPMSLLNRLPTPDGTTSFFYTDGVLKGHVKGSIKPWETLFLSLISLDPFVGSDKAYADPAETGNPFYTSLKPWRRNDSDMWNFSHFLHYWGWRL